MFSLSSITVADGSPLFRQAIKHLLEDHESQATLIETSDFGSLLSSLNDPALHSSGIRQVSLLLIDSHLPGLKRFNQLTAGRLFACAPVLLMVDMVDEHFLHQAKVTGIAGVVKKSATAEVFIESIRRVARGGRWYVHDPQIAPVIEPDLLSPKQSKVFDCLLAGMKNKQIAVELNMAEGTVKTHVSNIFRVLDLPGLNRTKLITLAHRTTGQIYG